MLIYYDVDTATFNNIPLEHHKCTEQELGLKSNKDSKFFPLHEEDLIFMEKAKDFFYCFDHSQIEIANQFDSTQSISLNIRVSNPYCELSKERYNSCDYDFDYHQSIYWKNIIILKNEKRFVADKYSNNNPIVDEALLEWYTLPQVPEQRLYNIQKTLIVRDDNLIFSNDALTEDDDFSFRIEPWKTILP